MIVVADILPDEEDDVDEEDEEAELVRNIIFCAPPLLLPMVESFLFYCRAVDIVDRMLLRSKVSLMVRST